MADNDHSDLLDTLADEISAYHKTKPIDSPNYKRQSDLIQRAHAAAEELRFSTIIPADEVYWETTWGDRHPDKPPTEIIFERGSALARLLAEEVVYINCFHWKKEWPEEAQKLTGLFVNCNDIFAWACSDAELLLYEDIQSLYDAWSADPIWGPAKWCAVKRNQKPQDPVVKAMKEAGAWDETMEALGENTMDAEVQAMFAAAAGRKLEAGEAS